MTGANSSGELKLGVAIGTIAGLWLAIIVFHINAILHSSLVNGITAVIVMAFVLPLIWLVQGGYQSLKGVVARG